MYSPKTLFNIISFVALTVVGGVSAQDQGPGFIFNCTTPGQVALTFDDGPAAPTAKLLDYLAVNKTPATFYVLGISINQPGGKELLQRTFDAGHQIALHSNTHADMNALTPAKVREEYQLNIKAVEAVIGKRPTIARPPFGNCNAACAKVLQGEMGLTITQWNCDSNDWRYETTPADQPKTLSNIADIINPSNPETDSFITLQHDIKDYSVEYVPEIIDLIAKKGYTFVTMEQCLGGKIPAYAGGAAPAGGSTGAPKTAKSAKSNGKAAADPAPASTPASAPAAGPGYLDASSSASGSASATGSTSANPSGSPSSAGKLASTFSLTLICLALSLLY